MQKKVIHEVPADELMKIALGSDEEILTDKLTEAAKFIYDMKIKQGDAKIPAELIYYTYKKWKGWGTKYQSKPEFFRDFKTFFTQHRTTNGMTYLLNPKQFDLSEETYWLMKASQRNEKTKKAKKS